MPRIQTNIQIEQVCPGAKSPPLPSCSPKVHSVIVTAGAIAI